MRGLILALIIACTLVGTSATAQQTQPPAPEKVDAQKPPEPKKVEREGSTVAVSYMLAIIGTIIIMVLVCMPARRE